MKRQALFLSSFVVLCCALASSQAPSAHRKPKPKPTSTSNQDFTPSCTNPSLPGPATTIDTLCGLDGAGTQAEAKQNEAKNNFCATGTPETYTVDQFANLQNQVTNTKGINFGDQNTPTRQKGPTTDRTPLQQMGEGKLVVFQGYVLNARQEGAESVNCGPPPRIPNAPENHDIHISLGQAASDSECSGIVAEMIPHHRPTVWTATNVLKVKNASTPVRVTGQLMFDSSHLPCAAGKPIRTNPARVSLWEVHPIYKFEVCTADCTTNGQWVSLEEWLRSH